MNTSKQHMRNRGFTLIEMVIYTVFVALIAIVSVNAILSMTKTFADLRIARDINNTATVAVERVVREIRNANDIQQAQSTFGTSPGRLTLDTTTSGGAPKTIEFYVDSGRLRVKEDDIDMGPLTSKNVTIDSLIFNLITTSNTSAVKVTLQVTASRGNVSKTKTFYNTVSLRGTY